MITGKLLNRDYGLHKYRSKCGIGRWTHRPHPRVKEFKEFWTSQSVEQRNSTSRRIEQSRQRNSTRVEQSRRRNSTSQHSSSTAAESNSTEVTRTSTQSRTDHPWRLRNNEHKKDREADQWKKTMNSATGTAFM
ncbi:hypothetical protein FRX31_020809 [Thalictrum thalictroides]|uniref:Uncharacterized protein n=1 Tax=Thalictrum thalictroides TaxID=46969 RepID=A0A7J6VWW6_THATH|nr:hypothetical protein FRX31_020809 [Thalictrum thalictroides]